MSSTMLEQAVIDAQMLKEAAIKNAEREILEKYSVQVKEAVDNLLEQDETLEDEEMTGDAPTAAVPDSMVDDIELKATEGETACPCPEEEEVVTIELPQIIRALGMEEEEEIPMDNMEMAPEEEEMETSMAALQEMIEAVTKENVEEQTQEVVAEETAAEEIVDEDVELTEENILKTIEEILEVDLEPGLPRGDLGTTHPTKKQQKYAVDVAAASMEADEAEEDNKALQIALEKIVKLEEHVNSLKLDKNKLVSQYSELKGLAHQVSEKLSELNISNAKLVYENRVLESNSLNERQKKQIVETITNASTIEEVKVIFDTLQSSLKSVKRTAPKNLKEAIGHNGHLVLKSNNKKPQVSDSASERMKRLAGII